MINSYRFSLLMPLFLFCIITLLFSCTKSFDQQNDCKDNIDCWIKKGAEATDNGKYKDAIANYTKAIKLDKGQISRKDVANIYNSRGSVYLMLKQFDDAITDFKSVLNLDPSHPATFGNIGVAYMNNNQYDLAIESYQKAIEQNPEMLSNYVNRGIVFTRKQEYDKALNDFDKAIALDPKDHSAYINRGIVFKKKQMLNEALRDFDKILEFYPGNYLALYHKACIYSLLNNAAEACKLLEPAKVNLLRMWPDINNEIRRNPDFDNIRKSECFQKIASE